MASLLYPKFKEALLNAQVNMASATIKCVLIDLADYTYSATHDFLNDVAAGARVGTPQTLASKTLTDGVFDAADVSFPGLTGDESEAILIYQDTGVESSSHLVALIDTAIGLPVTPTGADADVQWDNGANKIFAL